MRLLKTDMSRRVIKNAENREIKKRFLKGKTPLILWKVTSSSWISECPEIYNKRGSTSVLFRILN